MSAKTHEIPPAFIHLSINVNKLALIRNSREGNNPDLTALAQRIIDVGAHGITVHPRPDQRHIRPEDCEKLNALVKKKRAQNPALEFNIEGNPFAPPTAAGRSDFRDYPGFLKIIEQCGPDQATLVPDADNQLTSDHGFDLSGDNQQLAAVIAQIKALGSRVSLFMDPDTENIKRAADIGADRIELYTGPFAAAHDRDPDCAQQVFERHCIAAETAHGAGLEVNAGHDLNQQNLTLYRQLPHLAEVSIGHAFTIDCLRDGLDKTIAQYLQILNGNGNTTRVNR